MRARPVIATGARVTGSLKDTALITGASAGIGLELAKLFAADGHDLVLVARRADALEKLADSLRTKHNVAVRIWPADLADPRAPLQLHERAVAEGVAVDILVNNAGFGAIGHFHALPPERQLGIIDVNMRALTEMTYHFLPAMRERRRGRILNLGSIVGFLPGPYMAVYYASKAYVVSFSEALAEELLGSGITVTCLCPGYTATEFQKAAGIAKTGLLARLRPMRADTVARIGYRGLMAGRRLVVPGWGNRISVFGLRFSPRWFTVGAASWLQKPR
jgi:short-subunit dehydrogenase